MEPYKRVTAGILSALDAIVIIFVTTGAGSAPSSGEWDVKNYQTLIAAGCAFIIGMFTVINAFISNYISNRKHKRDIERDELDKQAKIIAFFSIVLSDVDYMIHSLRLSKTVLDSIDQHDDSIANWVGYVKIAQSSIKFQPITSDWEKVYIIGPNNIKIVRAFDLAMSSLELSFTRALSPTGVSSMPLFEKVSLEEETNRALLATDNLLEHIDEALQAARRLQAVAAETIGP